MREGEGEGERERERDLFERHDMQAAPWLIGCKCHLQQASSAATLGCFRGGGGGGNNCADILSNFSKKYFMPF